MEVPIFYLALKKLLILNGDIASKWRDVFGGIDVVKDVDEHCTVRRAENKRIKITQTTTGSILFTKKYIEGEEICYTAEEVLLLNELLDALQTIFNVYWDRAPTTKRNILILRDAEFKREVEAHPFAERKPMIERKYSRMYNVWQALEDIILKPM